MNDETERRAGAAMARRILGRERPVETRETAAGAAMARRALSRPGRDRGRAAPLDRGVSSESGACTVTLRGMDLALALAPDQATYEAIKARNLSRARAL